MTTPIAEKVAALLRQAENTTFPEEAEAFTAKAQALMAKHSIDAAVVAAASGVVVDGGIVRRSFGISGPYGARKVGLAHAVARATGCKGISTDLGASHNRRHGYRHTLEVFGTLSDVTWCEDLYNSLATQMTSTIARDTKLLGLAGGTGRQYGTQFVAGFTNTVAGRLRAVNATAAKEAQEAAVPGAPSVAVVLANKASQVEDEFRKAYPRTRSVKQASVSAGSGYYSGVDAGSKATIARGSVAASGRKAIG